MSFLATVGIMVSLGLGGLPEWTFDTDLQGWKPNAQVANVGIKDGRVLADTIGSDPFLSMGGLEIAAKPWQYVAIQVEANQEGRGQLFWSGETTGPNGGLSEEKCVSFRIEAKKKGQEILLFPFWQADGTIRQLRLDLYDGARFAIDSVRILEWGGDAAPQTDVYSWKLDDPRAWRVQPSASESFAPPLNLAVEGKNWAAVTLKCYEDATATLLWSCGDTKGIQTSSFDVQGKAAPVTYNIRLEGDPAWHSPIVALGVRLENGVDYGLHEIALADKPQGEPELVVDYVGFEDAIHHAGRPCRVLARVSNKGGKDSVAATARLALGPDMSFEDCNAEQPVPVLGWSESADVRWTVKSSLTGVRDVFVQAGNTKACKGTLNFTKNPLMVQAEYPMPPKPATTKIDVCAYYFPGWERDTKWDCIRQTAPIRKPMLGYYDEGNPECVDWQIKWAVENGISCFLVDWYWCQGHQSLTHWFEAYRKARYRDSLKVAIMWANHNAPNTHSPEDWRNVTQEWIDRYFNLPGYYRINGKPAVFIWAPSNVRRDLNGSEAVKKSMDESQAMAKAAGYEGITFVAMNSSCSASDAAVLSGEGYTGVTTYHEWGGGRPQRSEYAQVVEEAPKAWESKIASAKPLTYYPVVDTGWDSRPWHGDKAMAILGRTPKLFEQLLESAKSFATKNARSMVILGPVNEWGEGSYIEPCVEYGFEMYDAIRNVFCTSTQIKWAGNYGPADIGRGPYDFPPVPVTSAWTFDNAETGWKALMGLSDPAYADGRLAAQTLSGDPAFTVNTSGIHSREFSKAEIAMQIEGQLPEGSRAQLFWSPDAKTMTESTSASFLLIVDGQMHTYTVDLKASPNWRGRITSLRLDPCSVKDVKVVLDSITLTP